MSWADLLGGVLAGVAATGIAVLLARAIDFIQLRKYAGHYSVTAKQEVQPRAERALIRVRGNLLGLYLKVNLENLPPDDWAIGRVLMDGRFFGAGRYRHMKQGNLLFGAWDVQAEDDRTLLVTTTFVKSGTERVVVEGFRWERTD
jgi:hypothetical protein